MCQCRQSPLDSMTRTIRVDGSPGLLPMSLSELCEWGAPALFAEHGQRSAGKDWGKSRRKQAFEREAGFRTEPAAERWVGVEEPHRLQSETSLVPGHGRLQSKQ